MMSHYCFALVVLLSVFQASVGSTNIVKATVQVASGHIIIVTILT